jgi:hypothetical protein
MGGRRAPAEAIRRALDWRDIAAFGVRLGALAGAWECAKSFFSPERSGGAVSGAASVRDARLAFATIVLAGLVIFAIGVIYSLESLYVGNLLLETLDEITGTVGQRFDLAVLLPTALYQFLLYAVLGTVLTVAYEGVGYGLFRITGGSGTLGQHMYAGSVVWLAAAFSMSAALLFPLPCLQWFGVASMTLITAAYVLFYMSARAYSAVHNVSLLHACALAIPLVALRLGMWVAAIDALALLTGISPFISAGG